MERGRSEHAEPHPPRRKTQCQCTGSPHGGDEAPLDADAGAKQTQPGHQHHSDQHQANQQRSTQIQRNVRSEEHTSELQSLMRSSYAVFCLKKTKTIKTDYEKAK